MRNNPERFALTNVHGSLIKEWRTKDITTSGRLNLIETQGRKDVPSRHLTHIFIATQTINIIMIHRIEHLADTRSGFPRLTGIVIEIDNMVAGLVSMRILSDQTRYIRRSIFAHVALHNEERVELVCKGFVATED